MVNNHSQEIALLHHALQVGRNIYCLTAPNPGYMTGAGTNTYLLGEHEQFIVVDPGPNDDSHIEAILESVGGARNIAKILVTHMHPDHSPAAAPLARLSGAEVYGWAPIEDEYQDISCNPDHLVEHNEVISLDSLVVRCIHTPGHVDNHVCYLFENEQILITGDHIMQGSTVVIIPPHGKMKQYIESLQILKNYPIKLLAPGHGSMITTPVAEIDGIIAHRQAREAKVVEGLLKLTRAPIDELTEVVYDDVDPSLHPIAQLSLEAHLIKLEEESRVYQEDGKWILKN